MRLFSGANRVGEKTILGANVLLCASKRCRTPLLINMPQPNIVFSPTLLAPENSLIYEKYILPVISSSVPYQVFSPSNTFGKQVLQLLSQICTIQETKPDNELCTIQLLFQLWNILQKNMDWTSDSNSIHRLNHKQARLQAMMQYIHDHYMEENLHWRRLRHRHLSHKSGKKKKPMLYVAHISMGC